MGPAKLLQERVMLRGRFREPVRTLKIGSGKGEGRECLGIREKGFTAGFNLGLGFMENDGDKKEDDNDSILMGSNGGAVHLSIGGRGGGV